MPNVSNVPSRTIFIGDNLDILRGINSECVDLIYLDPPFKSDQTYAAPLDSEARGAEFDDVWTLDDMKQEWIDEIEYRRPALFFLINGAKLTSGESMAGYLTFMSVRLLELHRVLKPTGSIYLHCDPTASHYLKGVMDALFGTRNFLNEVTWRRTTAHSDARRYGANTDTILFYTKGSRWTWNPQYTPYEEEYRARFRFTDADGRAWADYDITAKGLSGGGYEYEYKGASSLWRVPLETMKRLDAEGRLHFTSRGGIRRKRYLDEMKGRPLQASWNDIDAINSQARERTGWRTQKPVALLERIIKVSSNPGDIVLDPFCGCATACIASEKLDREWIGIDIVPQAAQVLTDRAKRELQIPLADDDGNGWEDWTPIIRTARPRRTDDTTLHGPTDPRSNKELLYSSQQGKCVGCEYELPLHILTIDHITPRSRGGLDSIRNLQLLCHACNAIKGDRSMEYLKGQLQVRGILKNR